MTDPDRSKRALELCDKALSLPESEREDFLAHACSGDAGMRSSVDSILVAVNQAGAFMSPGGEGTVDPVDFAGRRVGQYEIKERLGEGGMGSVYRAERHEKDFEQQVAVKFVRANLLARELIERFNAERQILAALSHPYIAALIDGGTTEDGVPFIVMEYVDGEPIDEYCNSRALDVPARIELIRKVAMAVQAAHQNLIVHRDLKPSNVLVTSDGIPKLLDFGIAKLIGPAATTSGATTVFGHQALTPDYASPEQILENKVTTASDVYSLGILTYQLLVGELPYQILTTSHRDMMRSVEGLSVPRPSSRLDTLANARRRTQIAAQRTTTPQRLQRTLQGDLDNILLMALRQEPDRRYVSVAQYSEDLGRYLDGLPVRAREDSVRYRASKFLQRNWLATGAAALIVASLAGGLIAYATQAREAQRQRDIAREQAVRAEKTVDFLTDVLFVGDPFATSDNELTVADVLQYAQKHVSDEYASEPASRAVILTALGDIYSARGDYDLSVKIATDAVTLYEESLGTNSNEAANAFRAQALANHYLNEYESAEKGFRRAIDIYLAQGEPNWGGLAGAYDQLAMTLGSVTDEETALEYRYLAIDTYRQNNVDDPAQLITLLGNIAVEYLQKGEYEKSEPMFVEAIEVARASRVSDGQTGLLLSNFAGTLKNLGRLDEAVQHYDEAIELLDRSITLEHPETVVALTSLANLHQQMGNLDKAETVVRQAVASADKGLPPDHFITAYAQNVGGSILCRQGKSDEGMRLADASLQTRKKLLPAGHWAISSGEGIVGSCHIAAGEFEAAETALQGAYAALLESRGDEHEITLGMRKRLHELYTAWQKPQTAAQFLDQH